jgi:hypothetical protein
MRPFTDVLRDHRNGQLVRALTERMTDVVAAARESGKSSEITLKLKVIPDKTDETAFEIVPSITVKIPEPDLPRGLFYANEENDLFREPPKQAGLFSADETESERGFDRDGRAQKS